MASRTGSHLVLSRISLPPQSTLRKTSLIHFSQFSGQAAHISSRRSPSLLYRRGTFRPQLSPPSAIYPQRKDSSSSASQEISENMSSKVDTLLELAKNRRTYYKLGKNNPVPDAKVEELVQDAILHMPSSFNTQSTRLIVLLKEEHDKFWEVVLSTFLELVKGGVIPEKVWETQTKPKIEGFKAAYGTVLFYEDPAHIAAYSEKFPFVKDKFEPWAEHSNAMHQWFLWTALEGLGFGANLQHYNPVIDAPVAKEWNIPSDWRLIAQLVFGSIEAPSSEKQFKPVEERVRIYGSD